MNATPSDGLASLPLTAARRIDAACDRFEAAWQAGDVPPRIEDYLAAGPEADALLRELLLLDAHYRRRAGEAPATADYESRFPGLDTEWLRGALTPDDSARTATSVPRVTTVLEGADGYEILGELGRGGMGVVYRARQRALGREVALKVILGAHHAGAEELDRFRREAEAVARLQHPNIVQIFEVGEQGGQPFFALELVEGGTLAGRLAAAPLPPTDAAGLTAVLARAIQHAHERGIVHRDLKPGNVLLARDGTPKIADFGLAKRLDADGPATVSGALVGTPSYMAPEQAASQAAAIGPATDVYALGAILYEALTGRPPFKGADLLDTLQQVRFQEPVAVRALQPKCPRDLETVVLKCLQKAPGGRYASAAALAADLERFGAGRPVHARPTPAWEQAWKWAKRRPAVAGLSAAVVVVFAVGLALVSWQWQEAVAANGLKDEALGEKDEALGEVRDREGRLLAQALELVKQTGLARTAAGLARERADEAGRARTEAEERLESADRSDYRVRLGLAQREAENNQIDAARAALAGCRWDLRDFEHRYLWGVCERRLRTAWHAGGNVKGLAVSPDRRLVATGTEVWNGQSWEAGEVRVWLAATGEAVQVLRGHTRAVHGVAFSRDGKRLASASWDQTVRVWDLESGKAVKALTHPRGAASVALSGDGARLASGAMDGTVKVWSTETWTEEWTFQMGRKSPKGLVVSSDGKLPGPLSVAFSPDGKRLATLGDGGKSGGIKDKESVEVAAIWDLETGKKDLSLKGPVWGPKAVAFSPDGARLALAGPSVDLFDTRQGRRLFVLRDHVGAVETVAFSANGARLAAGGVDHAVTVWDTLTRQKSLTLKGHSGPVTAVAFTAGDRLVSAGDQSVRVWETGVDLAASKLISGQNFSRGLALHPDGKHLARLLTGGVGLVDVATGKVMRIFKGHPGVPYALAFSPDGQRLAAGGTTSRRMSDPGTVKVWSVTSGEELLTIKGHIGTVFSLAFSRDGKRLASASGGGRLNAEGDTKIWDAQTGKLLATCQGSFRPINRVAFSPDGTTLATASNGSSAQLWDAKTGVRLRYLHKPTAGGCSCVAFSPDGARVVTGHDGGQLTVWSAADGRELAALTGHTDKVTDVAFSPDGRRLASASGVGDRSVRLWDAASGEQLLALTGHVREVAAVTFSPDGERLISRGSDGDTKVWDAGRRPAILPLREEGHEMFAMRLRPDGKGMATAGRQGEIKLWDLTRGRVALTLKGHRPGILTLAYSPDGRRLVSAGGATKEPELKMWDAVTGKEVPAPRGHALRVSALAFSPDGRRLATGAWDKMVKVWDAQTNKELASFEADKRGVASLVYCPDGKRLATGSWEGKVRLWQGDGRPVRDMAAIVRYTGVYALAFSPDGGRLAGAGSDGVARVWDVATGKELQALRGHTGAVRGVAFRAGGKQLVTAGEDATLRVWDAATGAALFALSQEAAARGATPYYADGKVGGEWRVMRLAKGQERYSDPVTGRELKLAERLVLAQFAALGVSADGRELAASTLRHGAALYDLDALAAGRGPARP